MRVVFMDDDTEAVLLIDADKNAFNVLNKKVMYASKYSVILPNNPPSAQPPSNHSKPPSTIHHPIVQHTKIKTNIFFTIFHCLRILLLILREKKIRILMGCFNLNLVRTLELNK